jgi:hypothetical protein
VQWIDAQSASTDYQATQIIQYANPDAYFVLAGNIRQANITVHDNTVTDVKHVLTGYEIKPNPEYQAWLLLDESVRGGVAAPAETIQVSMEEDVPVVKTVHEKKALLNMDYRLADAVSSKVLLSKVIEKNNSYTSENVAAVEKGLFVQPEVKGLEQSDADIFHDITRLVAGDVAQALLEEVIKLQASYLAKADQAVVTEDFAVAATYYAYGFALQRQAGKVDEALLQKLRLYSLRWK